MNKNKLPKLWGDILENFLFPLNPDVSITCLLNILNSKFAQLVTFKRIKVQITANEIPAIVNYYGLVFISSGGGKDKVIREIDRYIFANFKKYFEDKNKQYIENKIKELHEEASKKYPESDAKQDAYIKEKSRYIRNIRFEIGDATTEGLYSDCLTLNDSGSGSAFVKIPEFGAYIESQTPVQKLFSNMLLELYDGSASLKSTKGESRSSNVDNIPVNVLMYSDTNKIINSKAGHILDSMLDCGLVRRSFITYMEDKPLAIIEDAEEEKAILNAAYEHSKAINEKLISILLSIPDNAVYSLDDEAYKRFHKYKNDNKKELNRIIGISDDVIKKELRGRFWKTLKLAGIIAAIEHPTQPVITLQDMEYAIYQSELFAESFNKFFKITPKTDAEKLFNFFVEKQGQPITTMDIRKQKFVSKGKFTSWIDENMPFAKQLANTSGYELLEESYGGATGNSGKQFILKNNNIGKKLNADIQDTRGLIGV